MLNDAWVLDTYLHEIKEHFKPVPPIVAYIPVDAMDHNPDWYKHFDIVNYAVAYTYFGKDVIKKAMPDLDISIIPHGTDSNVFYKISDDKEALKRDIFPDEPSYIDNSFIVLNANRNQPRKRLDISMKGFALFSEGKPDNVRYYHHAGVKDAYIDAILLAKRYGIEDRLILTNTNSGVQGVPVTQLNRIYNACDVGLCTSDGEGYSLSQVEHAVTGAIQVVPDSSATRELYEDCGLLIKTVADIVFSDICTTGRLVDVCDVARQLERLYKDRELMKRLGDAGMKKFTDPLYSWKEISKTWINIFNSLV
jgi:glycosyltransferase involved in cell wall biosynthesis